MFEKCCNVLELKENICNVALFWNKLQNTSCSKRMFITCDTGGSCKSSWSLWTTSVKSSAWKQTTSLVIRGWSLLEGNIFWNWIRNYAIYTSWNWQNLTLLIDIRMIILLVFIVCLDWRSGSLIQLWALILIAIVMTSGKMNNSPFVIFIQ